MNNRRVPPLYASGSSRIGDHHSSPCDCICAPALAASLFSRVWKVRKCRDGCYWVISIQNPLSFRPSSRVRPAEGRDKRNSTSSNRGIADGVYVPIERTIYLVQQITKCFQSRWILSRFYDEAFFAPILCGVFNEKYFGYSMQPVLQVLIKEWREVR